MKLKKIKKSNNHLLNGTSANGVPNDGRPKKEKIRKVFSSNKSAHKKLRISRTKDKKLKKAKIRELNSSTNVTNGIDEKEQKDASKNTKIPNESTMSSLKSVDATLFQYFNNLQNENNKLRTQSVKLLIKKLEKTTETDQRNTNLTYTLKRLVRGCGASTEEARTAFFTALTMLLKTFLKDITFSQVFAIMRKELNIGSKITNKDDSDAAEGRILICASLIRSDRILEADSESIEQVSNTLLQCTRYRYQLAATGFRFLSELMSKLSLEQFEQILWPSLCPIISVPWEKQTIHTIYCLLAIKEKYPTIITEKFLKKNFGKRKLLNTESFLHFLKIFWENTNTNVLDHPAFDVFGKYLATSPYLYEFWTKTVDTFLVNTTKVSEEETLKIATVILAHMEYNDKTNVSLLLTPNFVRMLVAGLKNFKTKKDPDFKVYYDKFLKALVESCAKIKDDGQKVEIIRKLILHPGTFHIEKFTNNRIVHQIIGFLGEDGVKEIFQLYKEILLNKKTKNSEDSNDVWLFIERQMAGYMLQYLLTHKSIKTAYDWRKEQLKFFMIYGLFHMTDCGDTEEICKKDMAGQFSKEFGDQMKQIFYSSFQSKLIDLDQEKRILLFLVDLCNDKMQQKHAMKFFRIQNLTDSIRNAWTSVYAEITKDGEDGKKKKDKKDKKNDKLQLVFHILLLNMGLYLFNEVDMAVGAIDDLRKCIERTKLCENKIKIQLKEKSADELISQTEPEWIEVVVDLFLHLLSRNVSSLRNIVTSLFSHLCANLSLTSIHQILSMLDMKDDNPLCLDDEEEDEGDEEEENVHSDHENDDNDDDDEASEEDDDDDDDDDDEDLVEENEDEGKTTDKLRNAISMVLVKQGAIPANDKVDNDDDDDDDMHSIDLNDMTEEEGKRLDEALSEAFKAYKKPNTNGTGKKKSKDQRSKTTTVMHFRIRVLDLIEIYLNDSPALLVCTEIMVTLYNMIEYSTKEELKPLMFKVEKVLTKLTSLRQFGSVDDIKEKNLVDFIHLIAEKKILAPNFDLNNRMRNKCIIFLILSSKQLHKEKSGHKIIARLTEYLDDFIKSRNPTTNVTLFGEIFKLRWDGVWQLAVTITEKGLQSTIRTFRRIQIFEILTNLYRNYELLKLYPNVTKTNLQLIENYIINHLEYLATDECHHRTMKEFQSVLEFLMSAHRIHTKLELMKTNLNSEKVTNLIQNIRRKNKLDAMQTYNRFCEMFHIQIVKNSEINESGNGKIDCSQSDEDGDDGAEKLTLKTNTDVKRKRTSKELRKEKKRKKEERMQISSKGLNGGLTFVQQQQNDVDMECSD